MAGETPNASRVGKQQQRKRLQFGDDKSTGKYYASKTPSVINNTPADSRGNINAVPQPIPTPNPKFDERSADKKYYAAAQPPKVPKLRTLGEQATPAETRRAAREAVKVAPAGVSKEALAALTIRRDSEVNAVIEEAARRIQTNPDQILIVTVASGSPLRRARAKLDSLVTRELLTEDLARDIRFSALKEEAPKSAIAELLSSPPMPAATVVLAPNAVDNDDCDIAGIMSGAVADDEVIDTSPLTPVEAIVPDEDDDTDEYVAPGTEPEPAAAPEADPLAPSEAPAADPLDPVTEPAKEDKADESAEEAAVEGDDEE